MLAKYSCSKFAKLSARENWYEWGTQCHSCSNNTSLFAIHVSKIGLTPFYFYITSINRVIRCKEKKAKYPNEKLAPRMENLGKIYLH